jgi:hypothetical protein
VQHRLQPIVRLRASHVACCMLYVAAASDRATRPSNRQPVSLLQPMPRLAASTSPTAMHGNGVHARARAHILKGTKRNHRGAPQHCARVVPLPSRQLVSLRAFTLDCRMQVMESRRMRKSGCCVLCAACCVLFGACLPRHACSISCEPKCLIALAHPAAHSTSYLINRTRFPRNHTAFRD